MGQGPGATPRQTPHPPRPHQVYGLQELLEAELLAVVLVQDAEHEVGRGHAVVEVGEQIGELLQRQAAGEVILKAVIIIIIPVITMILILSSHLEPHVHLLYLVCLVPCVLRQPLQVRRRQPGDIKFTRGLDFDITYLV